MQRAISISVRFFLSTPFCCGVYSMVNLWLMPFCFKKYLLSNDFLSSEYSVLLSDRTALIFLPILFSTLLLYRIFRRLHFSSSRSIFRTIWTCRRWKSRDIGIQKENSRAWIRKRLCARVPRLLWFEILISEMVSVSAFLWCIFRTQVSLLQLLFRLSFPSL